MSQALSNVFKLRDVANLRDPKYGAKLNGTTDDLAALNAAIADLNSGAISHLFIPPGTLALSAEPNVIATSNFSIVGAGPGATRIEFLASAGTAARVFRLGNSTTVASRLLIRDLRVTYANATSLNGTGQVFDLENVNDIFIQNIKINNANGLARLGRTATTAIGVNISNVEGNIQGSVASTIIDIENGTGGRFDTIKFGIAQAGANGIKGLHMHPVSGNNLDSFKFYSLDFNFPNKGVDTLVDLDGSQGSVGNCWFTDCVLDHGDLKNVFIHIDAAPHANAKINFITFTNCHANPDGVADNLVLDNTGASRFENVSVIGGQWACNNGTAVVRTKGGTATNAIELRLLGVEFIDEGDATDKPCIVAESGSLDIEVIACRGTPQQQGQTNNFTYLFAPATQMARFTLIGNNCRNFKSGVLDRTNLSQATMQGKIVENNREPFYGEQRAALTTTDASATTLATINLDDNRTYHVKGTVTGVQSDGTQRASYEFRATVYRTGGGNATIQGAVTNVHVQESNAAWDAVLQVNGANARLSVTGVAATTIRWAGTITAVHVGSA